MQPTVDNFFASTRALLGASRADVFDQWARRCFTESLGDFAPKARTFTLTEEDLKGDSKLTRLEVVEEGGTQSHYFELWDPPREYGLPHSFQHPFFYRHLFGDNGERRPGQPSNH